MPVESTKIAQPMEVSGDEFENTQRSEVQSTQQSQNNQPTSSHTEAESDTYPPQE